MGKKEIVIGATFVVGVVLGAVGVRFWDQYLQDVRESTIQNLLHDSSNLFDVDAILISLSNSSYNLAVNCMKKGRACDVTSIQQETGKAVHTYNDLVQTRESLKKKIASYQGKL